MAQTYSISTLQINTNIEKINIEFENMMSLGIIANEIISNSIKHHPKENNIILEINCYKKNDSVILIIIDNGLGFDGNIQKNGLGLELIKDFINKMSVALKEANETKYWIALLEEEYISKKEADSLLSDVMEILKMLVSIVKNSKENE